MVGFQTWGKEYNVDLKDKKESEFLIKLKKELSIISEIIIKNNLELLKRVTTHKKTKDPNISEFKIKSSALSIYFQEIFLLY